MFLETTTSEFYSEGFFGYGEKGDFQYFSFWHFLPIIILIASIILTYIFRERIKSFKYEKQVRLGLSILMFIFEIGYYWRLLYCGNPDRTNLLCNLPFQVCTWSAIFTIFMLISETRWMFDYCVFVCLTLGLIPLATPAVIVTTGPTYFRYYQFFFEHMIPIYSVFYLMFIRGFKFNIKRVWIPFLILFIGSMISIALNSNIEGANYFYLGTSTSGDSLANIMPENMWVRLPIYGAITIFAFGIEALIFWLFNKNKRKESNEDNGKEIEETQ